MSRFGDLAADARRLVREHVAAVRRFAFRPQHAPVETILLDALDAEFNCP